jgi:Zn-dependent membrane protease YugP
MFAFKLKQPIVKQIISVQLLWSILAPIIFMLGIFMRLGNRFTLVWMILLALSNIFIILRNAAEIDKNKQLYFKLNFNLI